jgi:hypothetical protein
MSNDSAKVNHSDPLASSLAGSRTSRRTFLKSLASAGLLLYVAPSTLAKPAWAAPANAKIVLRWNDAMLAAIPVAGLPGPAPNRALAIVHTAIYDAWTPYTERATPTQPGPSRRPKSERTLRNKSEAISYAAYRTLLDLFPTRTHKSFEDLMLSLGYNPGDTSTGETSPVSPSEIGNLAAQRVLKARRDDGSNQQNNYADTTGYLPADPPDPNHWQPLCLPLDTLGCTPQKFVTPHWGQVRPFGLSSGSELRNEVAGMLKAYPDQHYIEQHSEVLKLSAELDDRTKTIAEYWSDGPGSVTPPGHWNVIAQYVSRRDSHDLDSDVKLYFVLNNAMMDCSIAAWDVKRYYDSIRPISAIRFLYAGKQVQTWGGRTIDGAKWRTYIPVTPPHAEFVSGHSAVSRAAAELLKAFTGSNDYGASWKQSAGASLIEPGVTPSKQVTLSWDTFTEAAQQAGLSRLLGGIHISDGNVGGLNLGQEVAKRAWDKAQTYFNGD